MPVRPWEPPIIMLGERQIMTHAAMSGDTAKADLFTREGDELVSLGSATADEPLELDGYEASDSPVLAGMQDKDIAIHAGIEYEVELGMLELGGSIRQDISGESANLGQSALYCVTEVHTAADIRRLADTLKEVLT